MITGVKLLSLVTGEEVLGKVISSTDTTVEFENPVRVVYMPSKTDPSQPTVAFAPWRPFSNERTFSLNRVHVLTISDPIVEFVNQYSASFGGIVVPDTGKIIVP